MSIFHEPGYLRHNQARLAHLASLHLPIEGKTVLEMGAGIGDLTPFFLDRRCKVTVTDGRQSNVQALRSKYPQLDVRLWDGDYLPFPRYPESYDVIFCYGLLYHLMRPVHFLRKVSLLGGLLLLETCVSGGPSYWRDENPDDPRCGLYGKAEILSRDLIRSELKSRFPLVYMPVTQPCHEEFPLDWTIEPRGECRAVFIGSKEELNNPFLTTELPMIQTHHA
jgi:hypothetical protein